MTIIKINGEIGWDVSAREVKRQLTDASGDIKVEIGSPGGSVFQGVEIFNALKDYNKGKVTTVITSLAASMASYIALAGDEVQAHDNAVYMIHNASVYSWGDHRALRKSASIVESLSTLLAKEYVKKTGLSDTEVTKMMDDETYLFGDEIKDKGLVDVIIGAEGDSDLDDSTAKALATESVKACIASYKEHSKEEEHDEIAAILGVNPSSLNASAKIENQTKGESMSTKETYTALEVDAIINQHAEALDTASADATNAEKTRVTDIMALNGDIDVKMAAIKDGLTVGATAIKLNQTTSTQANSEADQFAAAGEELNNLAQEETPEGGELSADEKAIRADDAKYYQNKKGDK